MYSLVAIKTFGEEHIQRQGHNPSEVRAAHLNISRNPKVIRRIELRDHEGPIETVWDKTWT